MGSSQKLPSQGTNTKTIEFVEGISRYKWCWLVVVLLVVLLVVVVVVVVVVVGGGGGGGGGLLLVVGCFIFLVFWHIECAVQSSVLSISRKSVPEKNPSNLQKSRDPFCVNPVWNASEQVPLFIWAGLGLRYGRRKKNT